MLTVNQTVTFNSQLVRGNGAWKIMKIWNDGQVWLAKFGKKGQLLTPNQDNQMNVSMVTLLKAIEVGTAKVN